MVSSADSIVELLRVASAAVQKDESPYLRHACQVLMLPHIAAKLAEKVLIPSKRLEPLDKAELLLETRRFAEAEKIFGRLAKKQPADTHLAAQLKRIPSERQSDHARFELLAALRTGRDHWALQRPGLFTSVDRRPAAEITYEEFYANYTMMRRPLILTGVQPYHTWGWDLVERVCGHVEVRLRARIDSNQSVSWGGLRSSARSVLLKDWLAEVKRDAPGIEDGGFVFDFPLAKEDGCPELLQSFVVPRFFANDMFKRLPPGLRHLDPFGNSPGLFAQPARSFSELHVDALDSHFMQVLLDGRKRWTFFALEPERQALLLARRLAFEVTEAAPGGEAAARWYELIGPDGTDGTAELMQAAEAYRVEAILEPGEVLFVPGGVPHQVSQLAPSLALSLNYIDEANLGSALTRLEWLADFTRDAEKRDALTQLRASPPPHLAEPEDMLLSDLVQSL